MKIENLTAYAHAADRIAVEWDDGAVRYHFWVRDGVTQGAIYKNPLRSVSQRDPGYFNPRKLSVTSKANAKMLREVMARVSAEGLISKAVSDSDVVEQERLARIATEQKEQRVRAYGPQLLAIVKDLIKPGTAKDYRPALKLIAEIEEE